MQYAINVIFLDVSYIILTKIVNLEKSMNLLLPMIKQLLTHFRLTKMSHVENVPQIPVDSSKDLDNLEKFLDIRENFDYMVSIKILNVLSVRLTFLWKYIITVFLKINILSISGGTTIAQMTRRTLEKLITNDYATNYNWAGRAPKRAFKSLKMKDLIVGNCLYSYFL